MNEKKLSSKVKKLWEIIGGIVFIIYVAVFAIILIFAEEAFYPLLISVIICGILMIFACFVYPILRYKSYSYYYDEKKIVIKRGVLFKDTITIPVFQIQDLHIIQGPLMQILSLSSIEISTAGSNHSLSGLTNDDAKVMIDELSKYLEARIEDLKNETL